MKLDLTPLIKREVKPIDFAAALGVEDLRRAANESIDFMLDLIADLNDADVVFEPHDPDADDPYAVAGEEHIGWSVAHLIAHVTASTEEWAAYSSILARGVPYTKEPRLRYETPWRDITTKAQCVQRLEESRRMRLAALDMWPDAPDLHTTRELSERFIEKLGEMNAPASFLFGLMHEIEHHAQLVDAATQARAARPVDGSGDDDEENAA